MEKLSISQEITTRRKKGKDGNDNTFKKYTKLI
jgi:hypothetical protein